MKPKIRCIDITHRKNEAIREFGHRIVEQMGEYWIHLYLILNPEVIEPRIRPIGLEVNLPTGLGALMRLLKQKRIDLIFHKNNTYYIVECKARKPQPKDFKKLEEYTNRFIDNLSFSPDILKKVQIHSILAYSI